MAARLIIMISLFAASLCLPSVADAQRTGPTVCKDGSMLPRGNRRFCAPHGGVDYSATAATRRRLADRASAQSRARGPVTFACRDGSKSKTRGWNACAGHGGLAGSLEERAPRSIAAPSAAPRTKPAAAKPKKHKSSTP